MSEELSRDIAELSIAASSSDVAVVETPAPENVSEPPTSDLQENQTPNTDDESIATKDTPASNASDAHRTEETHFEEPAPIVQGGQMEPEALDVGDDLKNVLWAILKQVRPGMDLTKVNAPAFLLEPRSLLEAFADMNAFPRIFNAIGKPGQAPIDRLFGVIRWLFSALSSRKSCKKPYNPLLGEMFRCCWDTRDVGEGVTVFSSEQVRVQPPWSAFYLENRECGVVLNCHVHTRSKFFGNSVAMFSDGEAHVYLSNYENEEYTMTFPATYARNLVVGTIRMEYAGETVVKCLKTGLTAHIDFKPKGMFWGEWDCVEAKVVQEGVHYPIYTLKGKWKGQIHATNAATKEVTKLWDAADHTSYRKIVPLASDQNQFESQTVWKKFTDAIRSKQLHLIPEEKHPLGEQQQQDKRELDELGLEWQQKMFSWEEARKRFVYKRINTTLHDPEKEGPIDIASALRAHKFEGPDANVVALEASRAKE